MAGRRVCPERPLPSVLKTHRLNSAHRKSWLFPSCSTGCSEPNLCGERGLAFLDLFLGKYSFQPSADQEGSLWVTSESTQRVPLVLGIEPRLAMCIASTRTLVLLYCLCSPGSFCFFSLFIYFLLDCGGPYLSVLRNHFWWGWESGQGCMQVLYLLFYLSSLL